MRVWEFLKKFPRHIDDGQFVRVFSLESKLLETEPLFPLAPIQLFCTSVDHYRRTVHRGFVYSTVDGGVGSTVRAV